MYKTTQAVRPGCMESAKLPSTSPKSSQVPLALNEAASSLGLPPPLSPLSQRKRHSRRRPATPAGPPMSVPLTKAGSTRSVSRMRSATCRVAPTSLGASPPAAPEAGIHAHRPYTQVPAGRRGGAGDGLGVALGGLAAGGWPAAAASSGSPGEARVEGGGTPARGEVCSLDKR